MTLCIRTAMFVVLIAASGLAQLAAENRLTPEPKVQARFDRFYDYPEMVAFLRVLKETWPRHVRLETIGKSVEGRDIWMVTLADPDGPPENERPAIYIDANIHGNEIQGTETCLYTLWYLLENKDRIRNVLDLLRRVVFYVAPSVNPDGRQFWFDAANTSSSSRSGKAPVDSDRDGAADEDGPDDLDLDGSITQMRKRVGKGGTHRIDPDEPRLMKRVPAGEEGEYVILGSEGIDNDGDGDVNEDGPGGYDMNRNWPSDWQPEWIQFGAGAYPLSSPETRCIAEFILAHPNIAAVQAYHNAGGMILRGPGSRHIPEYPGADVAVYDELGRTGERMLPHYRYLVLWKDLYTVHGGFVNWAFEGLGIFAFTNELWNSTQYAGAPFDGDESARRRLEWDDLLERGQHFRPWKPFMHPKYGEIEIGGMAKTSSRVPPLFMLQELCHRNMAFTIYHAEQMPELRSSAVETTPLEGGLYRIRAEVKNHRWIPTIAALAREKRISTPDIFEIECEGATIVSGGLLNGPILREKVERQRFRPARLLIESGVPSKGRVRAEWIIDSPAAPKPKFRYASSKGGTIRFSAP